MPAFVHLTALMLAASPALAAEWQNNVNYGGSGGPVMSLYVPDKADPSPGIVVSLHYCSGNFKSGQPWFQSLADQHGFIIISPGSGPGKNCWNSTPTRSGEPAAIVQMVNYTITEKGADRNRVFAAGASSGACMTNALMAAYPDVFAGGSVLAGVPAGAWMGGNECGVCSQNPPQRTAQQWGDIVRNAHMGYTGPRPRVQLFHGTADTTLNYSMHAAELLQWTNVLGVGDGDATMASNTPKSGWTRTSYKSDSGVVVLESSIGQGVGHDLTGLNLWGDVVRFFGLDQDAPPQGGSGGAGGGPGAGSGGTAGGSGGSGGTVASGGTTASAGSESGGKASGGSNSAGAPSGGTTAAGSPGTGGGGTTSAAGSPTFGGSPAAAGNAAGGATAGAAGSSPPEPADEGGCGCRAVGSSQPIGGALAGLFAAGFAALVRRRKRPPS